MSIDYSQIDIYSLLDDYNISYSESGKNIGKGWIGIEECPFCGAINNHMGIDIQYKNFHCFACGRKGSLPKFLITQLNTNYSQVYSIFKKYGDIKFEYKAREAGEQTVFPTNMISDMVPKMAEKYLKERDFIISQLIEQYHIQFTKNDSYLKLSKDKINFSYRIIIPIIMNNQLVSYTGRDYTKNREPKYINPYIEKVKIPTASTIYNYDSIKYKGTTIIVEGITDVWRMGNPFCSVQGKVVTPAQIRFLAEKQLKQAIILFDEDAEKEAEKIGHDLTGVVNKVKVFCLEKGDPADLSLAETAQLKTQLLEDSYV